MKLIYSFILFAAASIILFSCKKDENKVTLKDAQPALSASTTSPIILLQNNGTQTALTLTYNDVNLGFNDALSYVLQIAPAGANFRADTTVEISIDRSASTKTFTVNELNNELVKIVPADKASNLEFRIKTNAGNIFSNIVSLTVTPFEDWPILLRYPVTYIPGDYQGWKPDGTPIAKLYSINSDNKYEGGIMLPDASKGFKLTPEPAWDHSYGMVSVVQNGANASGTLLLDGGADFKFTGAGYYKFDIDVTANTWKATKTNWGIIGDAALGWDADAPLTFDAATQTYITTIQLKNGLMKFRANSSWDVNLGVDDNGAPKYGGENIAITEAGTYKILFDVRVPSKPYWKLIKQ